MTEKRFKLIECLPNVIQIEDNNQKLNSHEIVDLLNELAEENEQLKNDVARSRRNFREMEEVKCELAEKNERLKKELYRVYDDDYYLKQFIMAIVTVFSSGNSGLSKSRYELIVNACEMNKTSLKEFFK